MRSGLPCSVALSGPSAKPVPASSGIRLGVARWGLSNAMHTWNRELAPVRARFQPHSRRIAPALLDRCLSWEATGRQRTYRRGLRNVRQRRLRQLLRPRPAAGSHLDFGNFKRVLGSVRERSRCRVPGTYPASLHPLPREGERSRQNRVPPEAPPIPIHGRVAVHGLAGDFLPRACRTSIHVILGDSISSCHRAPMISPRWCASSIVV
jgi:hypothetical protein